MSSYYLFNGISEYLLYALVVCVIWAVIRITNVIHIEFRKQLNLDWFCFNFFLNPFLVLLSRIIFLILLFVFFYLLYWQTKITEFEYADSYKASELYWRYREFISGYCFFFWFFLFSITVIWDFCIERYIRFKIITKSYHDSIVQQQNRSEHQNKPCKDLYSPQARTDYQDYSNVRDFDLTSQKFFYVDVGYIMGVLVDPNSPIPKDVKQNGDYIYKLLSQENMLFGSDATYSFLIGFMRNISRRPDTDNIRFVNHLMTFHEKLIQQTKKAPKDTKPDLLQEYLNNYKKFQVDVGFIMGYDLTVDSDIPKEVTNQTSVFNKLITDFSITDEDVRIKTRMEILKISKRTNKDDLNFEQIVISKRKKLKGGNYSERKS